jgi:hypothetical protein
MGLVFLGSGLGASLNYIYIAIRRGPMKVPTDGTKVFAPVTQNGGSTVTTSFPVDLVLSGIRNLTAGKTAWDRLRGGTAYSIQTLRMQKPQALDMLLIQIPVLKTIMQVQLIHGLTGTSNAPPASLMRCATRGTTRQRHTATI